MNKLCFERNSDAACHHELQASIRRVVKGREEEKEKFSDTSVTLRKIYDDERKVTAEAYVVE